MRYLQTTWFGVFLHDGEEIIDYILFPKEVDLLQEKVEKIWNGEILDEERKIAKGKEVVTADGRLSPIARYDRDAPVINIRSEDFGFDRDVLRKVLIGIAKKRVEKELSREDLQIIQMVKNLEELTKISNVLSERIAEWKNLPVQCGVEIVEKLKKEVDRSIDDIKTKLEEKMKEVAPNLSNLLNPILGAQLIAIAGSLEKLAKLPASSIQILGAEKALFRYKQGKGTPPKHGILFRCHLVRSAKPKERGKISRFLASKISVAAKADAFTRNLIHDKLKEEIEEFMAKIK